MRISITLFLLFLSSSCSNPKGQEGDSKINYPDMELIYTDYMLPFQNSNHQFLKIEYQNQQKDTTTVKSSEINWEDIHHLFSEANLFDEKLDKKYSISIIQDTLNPLMTLIYTSLYQKNLVQKLNIKARVEDNKINSIYWETLKHGFMSKEEKKILYVVNQTIQIQQFKKEFFSKPTQSIIQYSLANTYRDSL
ncbi:MAG: hypothetical protein IT215_04125 [Chitinophagaceae bacterium]|nr:hypothetical protein [Chitinophagaceae bacterium]HMN32500.1 hypothetical protein [Chitinophagaceae bacterium]